ncbi:uncharacterized protein [Nicotiana tomentosiformis]|uniref:uncharacterized protein n=1 Tax=Nicotiana tomentosiformis TaxID=4098 RepID=UPI00388C8D4C
MVKDCLDYTRRCKACQFHANLLHQPPEVVHPTVVSLPFDAWGLEVVGPLPKSSGGHLYILAATYYFSKWAEVVALKEVKKENVWSSRGIQQDSMQLIKKVISKSKRDWHDCMEEALWAYRTTHRTPTQATPYALVYGVEVVLPRAQIPSLRLAIQERITDEENARLRLVELEALDEKRGLYNSEMTRRYNKKQEGARGSNAADFSKSYKHSSVLRIKRSRRRFKNKLQALGLKIHQDQD